MSRVQVVGFRIVTGEDVMLNGSDSESGVREPVRFVTVTTEADVCFGLWGFEFRDLGWNREFKLP